MRGAKTAIFLCWVFAIVGVGIAMNGLPYVGMLAIVPVELIRRANFNDRETLKEFSGLHPKALVLAIAASAVLVIWVCVKSLILARG